MERGDFIGQGDGTGIDVVDWHERMGTPQATWSGRARAEGDDALARAVALLDAGGVVAHPTSTVYGLGGRPRPDVDARIAAIKRRQPGPLIRLAASRQALVEALPAARWTEAARRLADAFWPGPLTLVVEDGSDSGVAVRVDPHPVVRRLLELAGGMMTSTSLNLTGRPPARTSTEARAALSAIGSDRGTMGWLDVGDLAGSVPSTLVRMAGGAADVLREGAIPATEIVRALSSRAPGRSPR